ncbi:MAG: hypothetical protein WCG42_06615, partial [Parachlamydiaceae bacterium]
MNTITNKLNWNTSNSWGERRKICIEQQPNENNVIVKVYTQGLARRLFHALATILHIKNVNEFSSTKSFAISNLPEEIKSILSDEQKQLVFKILNPKQVSTSNILSDTTKKAVPDFTISKTPDKTILSHQPSPSDSEEATTLPSRPETPIPALYETVNEDASSNPPFLSESIITDESIIPETVAPDDNVIQQPNSELFVMEPPNEDVLWPPTTTLEPDISEIKNRLLQVKQILKHVGGSGNVYESQTWPAKAFDSAHNLIVNMLPSIKTLEKTLENYFTVPLPVLEEDTSDYFKIEEGRPLLENLLSELTELKSEVSNLEITQEVTALIEQTEQFLKSAAWFERYFSLCEELDSYLEDLNAQTESLNEGKLNCSLEIYADVVQVMKRLSSHGSDDLLQSKVWLERIKRKCEFHQKRALETLEDFSETLTHSIQIEADECKAHLKKNYSTTDRIRQFFGFELDEETATPEFDNNLLCLNAVNKISIQLAKDIQKFLETPSIPQDIQKQLREVLENQQKLIESFSIDSDAPEAPSNRIEELRAQRPPLTREKRLAIKKQLAIEAGSEYSPEAQRALRIFFGYLNAWSIVAPIAQKAVLPIGKKDYDYYIAKMTKAHKEENSAEYEAALNKARSIQSSWFSNPDNDFVEHYDNYLKGKIDLFYDKDSAPGKRASETSKISKIAKSILPTSVADWISLFLGEGEDGQFLANATNWQKWAHYNIFPTFRDQTFDALINSFEQETTGDLSTSTELTPSTSSDKQLFFHCRKMYEAAKDPNGTTGYNTHLQNALNVEGHDFFVSQYDSYLRSQLQALQSPLEKIPIETLSLGKAALKAIHKDEIQSQLKIEEAKKSTKNPFFFESMDEHAEKLRSLDMTCQQQMQTAPPEYSKKGVKRWLKEIRSCHQSYIGEKRKMEATISYERFKSDISFEKLDNFLKSSPIPVSNELLSDIFRTHPLGHDISSTTPNTVDAIQFKREALQQLKKTIENPLCTEYKKQAFCEEYLGNPYFFDKVHHDDLHDFLENLETTVSIAEELSYIFAEGAADSFEEKFNHHLSQLTEGHSFFFSDSTLGLAYEVIREPSTLFNSYTLRIYSSDAEDGIQTPLIVEKREKFFPFKEIRGIPYKKLSSEGLWSNLKKSLESKETPQEVYRNLLERTGGKVGDNIAEERLVDIDENSAYQTLTTIYPSTSVKEQLADRLDFKTQFKTLYDARSSLSENSNLSLLIKALTAFTYNLPKWHDKGILADNELDYAVGFAEDFKHQLSTIDQAAKEKRQPLVFDISQHSDETALLEIGRLKAQAPPEIIITNNITNNAAETEVLVTLDKPWDGSPETLNIHMNYYYQQSQIIENLSNESILKIFNEYLEFIKKIPLNNKAFWSECEIISPPRIDEIFSIFLKFVWKINATRGYITPTEILFSKKTFGLYFKFLSAIHYGQITGGSSIADTSLIKISDSIINTLPFLLDHPELSFEIYEIQKFLHLNSNKSVNVYEIKIMIEKIDNLIARQYIGNNFSYGDLFYKQQKNLYRIRNNQVDYYHNDSYKKQSSRIRPQPNDAQYLQEIYDKYESEIPDLKEILSLSRFAETQIQNTLSYFSENVSKLGFPQYRTILNFLFFENDLLIREFEGKLPKENEDFIKNTINFCESSISFFKKTKDYKATSELLRFAQHFHRSV